MATHYPVSFPARLLLIALGLMLLIGGTLYLLPASSLRYVGIYYAVVGVFNLFILPLVHLLRSSRLQLLPLEPAELTLLTAPATRSN